MSDWLECRAYKIRDVFDEMDLNGVTPGAMTYFRAMFACMKARRLGDTLYYWERMQHSGIQPDVRLCPQSQPQSPAQQCLYIPSAVRLLLQAAAGQWATTAALSGSGKRRHAGTNRGDGACVFLACSQGRTGWPSVPRGGRAKPCKPSRCRPTCAHAAPPAPPPWFCLLLHLAASHHSVAADSDCCVNGMQLMDEMRTKGLSPNKNTYLAALNALAETSRIEVCLRLPCPPAHCHARLRSARCIVLMKHAISNCLESRAVGRSESLWCAMAVPGRLHHPPKRLLRRH